MSTGSLGGPQERGAQLRDGGRLHALDALRATALLLGVVFHAMLAYIPDAGPIGWAVQDRSTHRLFAWAATVLHSFRMPVFFFIAGFFGRSLRERRGTRAFAVNRVSRILVPLVLGWLLVYPLVAFAWEWATLGADPASVPVALKNVLRTEWTQLLRFRHPSALRGAFPLTHLWFLYVLLILYGCFIPARAAWVRLVDRTGAWRAAVDGWLRRAVASPWLLAGLAVPTSAVLFRMKSWGIDTPDASLAPPLANLLLYALLFGIGWQVQRQPDLLDAVADRLPRFLAAGAAASACVIALVEGPRPSSPHAFRAGFMLLYALMMWSLLFAAVGVAVRRCSTESRAWRYLADASYWVYIVHLPLVCVLQVVVSRVEAPAWSKFAVVTTATVILCLASYHLLVRSTVVGVLLNGRRHPFAALPLGRTRRAA